MPVKRCIRSSSAAASPVPLAARRSAGATMSKAVCVNRRVFTPWPLVMKVVAIRSCGRNRRWLRYPGQEPPWPHEGVPVRLPHGKAQPVRGVSIRLEPVHPVHLAQRVAVQQLAVLALQHAELPRSEASQILHRRDEARGGA